MTTVSPVAYCCRQTASSTRRAITDHREENEAVSRAVAAYPDRLIGAIRLNPLFGEEFVWETVRYFVEERGLGGIKLVARADFYNPSSLRVIGPVFEAAAQYNIPILFHSGHPSRDLPSLQGYAARQYPQVTVIIAHIGLHDYLTETILACKEAPNVFAEMSQAWPSISKPSCALSAPSACYMAAMRLSSRRS